MPDAPLSEVFVSTDIIHNIIFYLFAGLMVLSAVMVISARNPVHSVLFLIFAFVNAAGIFLLTGAEFLAMIIVIVYVGAVAVLFLFVVMMLDVDFSQLRSTSRKSLPLSLLIGLIFLGELVLLVSSWQMTKPQTDAILAATVSPLSNTEQLAQVLYTDYLLAFMGAGTILLVAMIGAIVLTLRHRPGVRRQSIKQQIWRDRHTSVTLQSPPIGRGTGEITNIDFRG